MELPSLYEAIKALELKLKAEELLEHAFLVSDCSAVVCC